MGEGSGPIRTPRAAIRGGAEGGARGKSYFFSWLLSQGTFSHLNAHPVRDERGAVAWPGREAEAQLGVVSELGRSVSDEALHLHEHRATLVRLLEPQDVALTAPGKLNLYRTAGEGRVDFHCRRPLSTGGSGAVAHVRDTSIESSIRVCEGAGVFRHHVRRRARVKCGSTDEKCQRQRDATDEIFTSKKSIEVERSSEGKCPYIQYFVFPWVCHPRIGLFPAKQRYLEGLEPTLFH